MRGKLVVWREVGESSVSSAGDTMFLPRAVWVGRAGPGWSCCCQQTLSTPSSWQFALTIETAA